MAQEIEYASYLVRIWREPDRKEMAAPPTWTAEVESIQSGESWRFPDLASLIAFLEETCPPVIDQADS